MLYALICTDKPDSFDRRKEMRPEHVAYLKSLGSTLVLAGPFMGDDGETMNGSLVVVEAASMEEAQTIGDSDPYAKAGIFAKVEVRPWSWTLNKPAES